MINKYLNENGIVDDLPYRYCGIRSHIGLEKYDVHITVGSSNSGAYKRYSAISVAIILFMIQVNTMIKLIKF